MLNIKITDKKNNCVLLKDGTYVECLNFIISNDGTLNIIGRPLKVISSFYSAPIDSKKFHIVIAKTTENMKLYSCEFIFMKVYKIPLHDRLILCPIHHTVS